MMRKLLILPLLFALAGCAAFQTAFDVATTPVTVTPAMQNDIESGFKAATAGLVGYRRLCIKKVIDPVTRNCRAVIEAVQPYTKAAAAALVDLRVAVATNNQVNAIATYKALQGLIVTIQAERQKAGVN
jgi:hypothetical protein